MTAVGTATRSRRANGRRAAADRDLNVEAVRKQFPALAQRVHGQPLVYLDSAATSHRPVAVIEAMEEFYRRDNSNPHSEVHELGKRAKRTQVDARKTLAKFINAEQSEEVVWVGNLHAQPLLTRFGVETAARASCWIYNTTNEIDRFVDALEDLRG